MLIELVKGQVKISQGEDGSISKIDDLEIPKIKSDICEARLRANKHVCTNRMESFSFHMFL